MCTTGTPTSPTAMDSVSINSLKSDGSLWDGAHQVRYGQLWKSKG